MLKWVNNILIVVRIRAYEELSNNRHPNLLTSGGKVELKEMYPAPTSDEGRVCCEVGSHPTAAPAL
eukprot:7075994-Pyramimonas_sp.AAC.1